MFVRILVANLRPIKTKTGSSRLVHRGLGLLEQIRELNWYADWYAEWVFLNGYAGLKFRLPFNTATKSVHRFAIRTQLQLVDYQLLSTQTRLRTFWILDALTAAKLFGENVAQVDGLTWRGAPRRKTADVDGSCAAVTGDGWSSLE